MAAPVTDYASLQAAIKSYLWDRQDVADQAPVFISLCEAQLTRRLKVRRMTGRATATIESDFAMVPSDFAGVQSFYLAGTPLIRLQYAADPQAIVEMKAVRSADTGKPEAFTVVGDQFEFCPAPAAGESYTAYLTYYKRIPALSDSNTTNWLLTDHPDAYLYGSLLQSAPWLREDDRIVTWGNLYTQIIADIQDADRRETTAHHIRMPDRFNVV